MEAYILVHTKVGEAMNVADMAAGIEHVLAAEAVTGPFDVIVRAWGASLHDLAADVVAKLQTIPGVTRTLTCPMEGRERLWEELIQPAYAVV